MAFMVSGRILWQSFSSANSVGNALRGVPRIHRSARNATQGVPYRCFALPEIIAAHPSCEQNRVAVVALQR